MVGGEGKHKYESGMEAGRQVGDTGTRDSHSDSTVITIEPALAGRGKDSREGEWRGC